MAGRGAKTKKPDIPDIDPHKPYSMDLPRLGHAVIVNNVHKEMKSSAVDVEALEKTFKKVGFDVQVYNDCDAKKMGEIKSDILQNEKHRNRNCFLMTVICHGNDKGHLLDKKKKKGWVVEDLIGDLSNVKPLRGRPKILLLQSCRGAEWSDGKPAPSGTLADEDVTEPVILPDKSDMFVAYATVPGYRAHGGDNTGSAFLQASAAYLTQWFMSEDLGTIFNTVNQYMASKKHGEAGMLQVSEKRSTLRFPLKFSEFHQETSQPSPRPRTKPVLASKPGLKVSQCQKEIKLLKQQMEQAAVDKFEREMKDKVEKMEEEREAARKQKDYERKLKKAVKLTAAKLVDSSTTVTVTATSEPDQKTEIDLLRREMGEMREKMKKMEDEREAAKLTVTKLVDSSTTVTTPRHVELKLLSTHDTGLQVWDHVRFTVLSAGEVIMWGKSAQSHTDSVHNPTKASVSSAALHISCLTGTGLKKKRKMRCLCEHDKRVFLHPVRVNNKEQVAVSCPCDEIRLYNTDTGEVTTAFHSESYYPGYMYAGEGDILYAVHDVVGSPVLELNTARVPFTVNRIIQSGMKALHSIHYVPYPYNNIIFSKHTPGLLRAVSAVTGQKVWEVRGEVDGVMCDPHGLLFSPIHQILLVADGTNSRVLVLHPGTGAHLQTLPLGQDIGDGAIWHLSLRQNKILLTHRDRNKTKVFVSCFDIL